MKTKEGKIIKVLAEALGKEIIDTFNTFDTLVKEVFLVLITAGPE